MSFDLQNPDGAGQQAGAAVVASGTPDPATIGTTPQQPAPATPEDVKPGSTAQPGKTGEGSLTLDDVRKVIGEVVTPIVREETSKVYRANQSANAKLEERVKADFKQQMATLNKSGITPTAEQSQALLDQTRTNILTEAEKNGQVTPAAAQQPEAKQATPEATIVTEAMQMIKDAGLENLNKEDPEFTLIDQQTNRPSVFLNSVQKAIDAKLARLQTQGNTRARNISTAAGVGKTSGSGIANVTNPDELYRIALGNKR